jgi:hypothetical protein
MPVDTFGNPTLVAAGGAVDAAGENARTLRIVRTYPTAADRDQDLPTPHEGEVIHVATLGPQIYEGGAWKGLRTADDEVPWSLVTGKPTYYPTQWSQITGIPSATTSQKGIVELQNSVGTGSTTLAPTAALLDVTWDAASDAKGIAQAALPKSGGTITGGLTVAGAGTTSNNTLPGWRQLSTSDRSLNALVSSVRYKRAIEPVDTDELVAVVRSAARKLISWEERGSPDGSPRFTGISAEDAVGIVPTSVAYDDKGRPDSVDPANAFAVPLVAAVAQLLDRIDELELQVQALQSAGGRK